jgi:hypothetical protein
MQEKYFLSFNFNNLKLMFREEIVESKEEVFCKFAAFLYNIKQL